ncbi:putative nuclease HARBI1 [Plectropomus leopardus]|uniref:putative nuclease HARBI1 n=1 Tax=Plectropomus leopardus TaxID=160734 RepID=UPI001C4AE2AD|nr:putative nuclease HARBI1 [Plectropomus leopardus]
MPVLRLYLDEEANLKPDYWLSRASLENVIAATSSQQDHGWGHYLEVLVFVFWLASATSYRVVSRSFGIPRTTVHDMVHKVSRKLLKILKRVIHLPSAAELEDMGNEIARLAGSPAFSRAVGSIDGCHIRIKPPSLDAQCYLNRKLFPSIQLQAVCDHRGRYLDIFAGYPGSVHDSRVLKNSPLYTGQLYPPQGFFILGDGGYPCLSAPIGLITPYKEPVHQPTARCFNYHHAKARSIVERSFGSMKTRWRTIFFKALEVKPTFAPDVIACCAILHNVCLSNGDIVEPAEEVLRPDDDAGDQHQHQDQQSGERIRELLMAAVSAPDGRVPALEDHDYM